MTARKPVALALQGGGSHGAFTWGVLETILDDDRLEIESVSGTSAGSINAALLAYGMDNGGPAAAKKLLKQFWTHTAQYGLFSPLQPSLYDRLTGNNNLDYSPMLMGLDFMTRLFSPYQFNPLGLNPLRDLLTDLMDFGRLRSCRAIRLHISATNVRTCHLRIFENHELTVDALLASCCLPHMFRAVEIDGEGYWDGGYMGNPSLYPLIQKCRANDIVIVQINPIFRADLPRTANAIMDRLNEISFNSSLIHELRGLVMVNKLLRQNPGAIAGLEGYRHLHLHMVHDVTLMSRLGHTSKMNIDYDFLVMMRDAGRAAAQNWLDGHFETIGRDSSIDISKIGTRPA